MPNPINEPNPTERFFTINEAATRLGIPAWKLRRAAKAQLIPSYRILNQRRLVRLSEVVAALTAFNDGGAS